MSGVRGGAMSVSFTIFEEETFIMSGAGGGVMSVRFSPFWGGGEAGKLHYIRGRR